MLTNFKLVVNLVKICYEEIRATFLQDLVFFISVKS